MVSNPVSREGVFDSSETIPKASSVFRAVGFWLILTIDSTSVTKIP